MTCRWNVLDSDGRAAGALSRELDLCPLLARLLVQRGFNDPEKAWAFLNPTLESLHDPFLMKDMDRAVDRILAARERREKVLIHGDYDVDGITSTVVLRRALQMLDMDVEYHIPRRLEEGYGMRPQVLRQSRRRGVDLVVSADSGIRDLEAARAAREAGLDLIVTDHHRPGDELPDALAVVNPRRSDCPYPDKNLAAVGVVFKLVQALFQRTGQESVLPHFLKLVAIGTVADVVPLLGENRVFVSFGLKGLADPRNVGLRALLSGSGVGPDVDVFDLAFRLSPRINAVTRMGGGDEAVELFSARDEETAGAIVEEMNAINARRQREEQAILAEIEERFENDPQRFKRPLLLVSGRNWHRGVIGIVASRLVERFYRPALVISVEKDSCQGSGRSIPGFDLLAAMDACRHYFERYGGHTAAVGCTIEPAHDPEGVLSDLARELEEFAGSRLSEEDLSPSLKVDAELDPGEISFELLDQIDRLSPFGHGNPLPVFASRGMQVVGGPWLLKERHLKMRVRCNGAGVDAIMWRNGELCQAVKQWPGVDLAYTIGSNTYMGEEKLLLTIRDVQIPGSR